MISLNTSTTTFGNNPGEIEIDKFESKLSVFGDIAFGTLLLFAGILSIVGNGCILTIFYYRRQQLSPAEIFLVNLGVVDILLSIAGYPCVMISSFHHRWIFGFTGCTLYAFVCYFFGVASIHSLAVIAVIRFLKTCHPVYGAQINNDIAWKIINWIYLYSLLWACLPLIGFGGYDVEPFGLSCTLEWNGSGIMSSVHIIVVVLFCVLLPTIVIIYSYVKIVMLVRDTKAALTITHNQTSQVSDIQLTWMTGLVCAGFIIAWCPYAAVSVYGTLFHELLLPMWATPIPVLLAKSSIAYNPFIYIFFTKRYRNDFYSILETFRVTLSQSETDSSARRLTSGPENHCNIQEGETHPTTSNYRVVESN